MESQSTVYQELVQYQQDSDSFILTRQFRYPAASGDSAWMLEIVAGSIEGEESHEEAATREVQEEIGYRVSRLMPISSFYPSPGGTSEKIFTLYCNRGRLVSHLVGSERPGPGLGSGRRAFHHGVQDGDQELHLGVEHGRRC